VFAPHEGNKHEERWRSGKIHGGMSPTSNGEVHEVELPGGIPAKEAVFLRPVKSRRRSRNLFNIGPSEHYIKFRSKGGQLSSWIRPDVRGILPVDEWETFEIADFPIIIVGWSVSCRAATKKTTVVESAGGILDDFLTLKISDSPNLKGDECWHCRVTFVHQAEYDGFLT
jgi:hypothetical protein